MTGQNSGSTMCKPSGKPRQKVIFLVIISNRFYVVQMPHYTMSISFRASNISTAYNCSSADTLFSLVIYYVWLELLDSNVCFISARQQTETL